MARLEPHDYSSSGARAFREHYDKLVNSIQESDLPVLGAGLFSRLIISHETMEMVGNMSTPRAVRTSKLMLAVIACLETYPDKFESVLSVFGEEPVYSELSALIKHSYDRFLEGSRPPPVPPTTTPPTTAIGRFATQLKKMYLRTKLPMEEKWPPSQCKKVIKLAVVERNQQDSQTTKLMRSESVDVYMTENKATPISLDDLLQSKDGAPLRTVVVQGVPGIGKSTFAWKFCRKWAKGKIYQQYDLVVLLRMRDTTVREAKTLSALFSSLNPFNEELSRDTAQEVASRGGKGVIFLFEGLDELPSSLLADSHCLLLKILRGFLPDIVTLVTSRLWAVKKLAEKIGDSFSRLVEILGFTKEDILSYASHTLGEEERGEFLEYLRSHPQLESIMHIPLNAASVVQIYKQFKHLHQAIPQTLTQLYTALVKSLLLRYMKDIPEFSDFQLTSLESLPEPIKTHFEQLCLLAFMSFTKLTVQVTFTDSEAALYGCLDSLGLMQSSADLSIDTGTTVTHSFLHFTIQEFLAAYHLSKQSEDVHKLFLEVHDKDPQFEILIKFLIGLNHEALLYVSTLSSEVISSADLHWLYESQSPEYISKCLGHDELMYLPIDPTPFDYYALSYCVCYSNCKWSISLDMSSLTTLFPAKDKNLSHYSGQIVDMDIHSPTLVGVQQLLLLPQQIFANLHTLDVNNVLPSAYLALAEQVRKGLFPSLKIFCMSYSDSVCTSIVVEALSESCPSLEQLSFYRCSFNQASMLPLCAFISSSSCLRKLMLYHCSFDEDSLQYLISSLPHAKSLALLGFSDNKLSLPVVELLSVALTINISLETLNISNGTFANTSIEVLANALEENHTLRELSIHDSNLGISDATALASMLTVNTSLQSLDLSGNRAIGTEGAIRLINALEQNKSLKILYLPLSCEPVEFRSILMESIRNSKRVTFI